MNTKMFKLLNNGKDLALRIKHPNPEKPDILLSFDPCHILKNVWCQFVDGNRVLKRGDNLISSEYHKKIYDLETKQKLFLNSARVLKHGHLYPDNFQKQNVQRAVDVFSKELMAAIKAYKRNKIPGFFHIEETILFMEYIHK